MEFQTVSIPDNNYYSFYLEENYKLTFYHHGDNLKIIYTNPDFLYEDDLKITDDIIDGSYVLKFMYRHLCKNELFKNFDEILNMLISSLNMFLIKDDFGWKNLNKNNPEALKLYLELNGYV